MYHTLQPVLQKELAEIENAGLTKRERIITSAQGAEITIAGGQQVINFCANNYLWHTRHTQNFRRKNFCFFRHRRYHTLCCSIRCQWRCIRAFV